MNSHFRNRSGVVRLGSRVWGAGVVERARVGRSLMQGFADRLGDVLEGVASLGATGGDDGEDALDDGGAGRVPGCRSSSCAVCIHAEPDRWFRGLVK